jgi:hypothetical protein
MTGRSRPIVGADTRTRRSSPRSGADSTTGLTEKTGVAFALRMSWRPIAAALGVSTTTLVHHFGTKEQLLEARQR